MLQEDQTTARTPCRGGEKKAGRRKTKGPAAVDSGSATADPGSAAADSGSEAEAANSGSEAADSGSEAADPGTAATNSGSATLSRFSRQSKKGIEVGKAAAVSELQQEQSKVSMS
jgi:hypothetical protein